MARPDFDIIVGDNRETLKALVDASVHCVVTSPPYWGLRRYGDGSQRAVEHGAEGTLEEHIGVLVEVFREVHRVLHPSGTLWLNYGDRSDNRKQLQGMPWLVAFALQANGWWLRSDIVWHKPAPMPESVTDRPTRAHEYMFLMTKAPRYFYDAEAVKEKGASSTLERERYSRITPDNASEQFAVKHDHESFSGGRRNLRDVWTIPADPTRFEHFAAFPRKLVTPCVLAGTSEKGCCPTCLAPWERVVERTAMKVDRSEWANGSGNRTASSGTMVEPPSARTTGWRPTCDHNQEPIPCTVLDPYCGTGRTGAVAVAHGRRFIGLELYENYADYARQYIANPDPMPVEAETPGQMGLFGKND